MKKTSLPVIPAWKRITQKAFSGIDISGSSQEGKICETYNISSDEFPLLASRRQGYSLSRRAEESDYLFENFFSDGERLWMTKTEKSSGDTFLLAEVKGEDEPRIVCELSGSRKITAARLGNVLAVFPDKIAVDLRFDETTHTYPLECSPMEITLPFSSISFTEVEEGSRIRVTYSELCPFSVGDVLTVSGCTTETKNNKSAVIRQVENGFGRFDLLFDPHTFVEETESESLFLALSRHIPSLTIAFACGNRLWGTDGESVFGSSPGNPFSWKTAETKNCEAFREAFTICPITAGIAYLSCPTFFSENGIFRVLGDRADNFRITENVHGIGVEEKYADTLCIAGNILYFLNPEGVFSYSGSFPKLISGTLPSFFRENDPGGKAGKKDGKVFFPLKPGKNPNAIEVLVFDTEKNAYLTERIGLPDGSLPVEDGRIDCVSAADSLFFCPTLLSRGDFIFSGIYRRSESETEEEVESMVLFDNLFEKTPDRKRLLSIQLRLYTEGSVSVFLGDGDRWEEEKVFECGENKNDFGILIPIRPNRFDRLRLKLVSHGYFRLYSITRNLLAGSAKK